MSNSYKYIIVPLPETDFLGLIGKWRLYVLQLESGTLQSLKKISMKSKVSYTKPKRTWEKSVIQ